MGQAHFFFAASLPEETKEAMKEHINQLKEEFPFSRWVHHQDIHITLAFLGAAPEEKLSKAKEYVAEAVKNLSSFDIEINSLGVFGPPQAPRVFWAGLRENAYLVSLRDKVFNACEMAGFKLETRPFAPHLTLARKWNGNGPFNKIKLDSWTDIRQEPLKFNVNKAVLYQSHLDRAPKYEEKAIFHLEG